MKLLQILKSCLNYKVIVGVGIIIAVLYLIAPDLAKYSWVLLVLVCPLSIIAMMTTMNKQDKTDSSIKQAGAGHE